MAKTIERQYQCLGDVWEMMSWMEDENLRGMAQQERIERRLQLIELLLRWLIDVQIGKPPVSKEDIKHEASEGNDAGGSHQGSE